MNRTKDGGPAFPNSEIWDDDKPEIAWIAGGLSKREWFAGQALAGMMANPDRVGNHARYEEWAKTAYFFADAMIAEGEKS